MPSLHKLIVSMKYDAAQSCEKLLKTMDMINAINTQKHNMCHCFTTEVIDGIASHVMEMMAYAFDRPISLPTQQYKSPRVCIQFRWGSIILLQQDPYN